ncbi:MAG TPA: sortase [Candidatus Paceibacterota bacterium]|nr:sortase [Candidatus Paceibacterota bacterium]
MAQVHDSKEASGLLAQVFARKFSFVAAFTLVFFVTFSVLQAFELVPEEIAKEEVKEGRLTASVAETVKALPEYPTRIEIPAIEMNAEIANPTSTNVAVLDRALLKTAVRYPTSARLGEEGNVILFGHSSYLPVVNNEAYKIFNEIQKLEEGDRITVYGTETVYVYEVDAVEEKDAEADAIPLTVGEPTLTLSTCDSFGKKTDRFVVTAKLVGSHPIED